MFRRDPFFFTIFKVMCGAIASGPTAGTVAFGSRGGSSGLGIR